MTAARSRSLPALFPSVLLLLVATSISQSSLALSPKLKSHNVSVPRRTFFSYSAAALATTLPLDVARSNDDIAARAALLSSQLTDEEQVTRPMAPTDQRTVYDFELPVRGQLRNVAELVGQEGGDAIKETKVKAILVVNMKQDDPIARKNIPELIALVNKFGNNGEFVVILSPTDQGYYEPDTSALLRLKLASEYGYGNLPGTILTDKVNLLGSGAVPFWRWLQGTCRTPAGLGKIQANFEKFLVDGRTGKPLRRYPRKYQPYDIAEDIAAILRGEQLPPANFNFKEEWRNAAKEAENDTYRFQKGLNYFDQ